MLALVKICWVHSQDMHPIWEELSSSTPKILHACVTYMKKNLIFLQRPPSRDLGCDLIFYFKLFRCQEHIEWNDLEWKYYWTIIPFNSINDITYCIWCLGSMSVYHSFSGFSYFMDFYPLKHQNEVFDKFFVFHYMTENFNSHKIKVIESNCSGDFTKNTFTKYTQDNGIIQSFSSSYTLELWRFDEDTMLETYRRWATNARIWLDRDYYDIVLFIFCKNNKN